MFDKTLFEQFKTNKHERSGILGLIVLILVVSVGLKVIANKENKSEATNPELLKIIEQYYSTKTEETTKSKPKYKNEEGNNRTFNNLNKSEKTKQIIKVDLFQFDPNKVNYSELQRLGFSSKQANTLLKFRKSGFTFRKPEDVAKVYGLDESLLVRLNDYMIFPSLVKKELTQTSETKEVETLIENEPKISIQKIEINTATHEELISIYGIGNVYASSILKYRDKLGGYINLKQLPEAYPFPDSTFNMLQEILLIDTSQLKKINLNTVSFKELLSHPYITYEQNQILYPFIETRRPIENLDFLKDILLIDSSTLNKVRPYLSAQ